MTRSVGRRLTSICPICRWRLPRCWSCACLIGLTVHFWNYMWIFWGICLGVRASLREWSFAGEHVEQLAAVADQCQPRFVKDIRDDCDHTLRNEHSFWKLAALLDCLVTKDLPVEIRRRYNQFRNIWREGGSRELLNRMRRTAAARIAPNTIPLSVRPADIMAADLANPQRGHRCRSPQNSRSWSIGLPRLPHPVRAATRRCFV